MEKFEPTAYTLECVATGREFEDTGWMLSDPQCKEPSLIRARYAKKQIEVKPAEWGLYRFADWMPVRRMLKGSSAPVTYRSKGLAERLGLENLWITFNGYYPAIGATMTTCSFKETEAYSVCGRAAEDEKRVLVSLRPAIRPGPTPRSARTTTSGCCCRCRMTTSTRCGSRSR